MNIFKFFKKSHEEEKKSNPWKIVLITLGVIAGVAALAVVIYTICKKYFTITIECDENDCDCDLEECCDDDLCCCEAEECAAPEIAEA